MTRAEKIDGDDIMQRAWKAIEKLIADPRPHAFDVYEFEDEYRRRCRKLDRWRKKNGCSLTGGNKEYQRYVRTYIAYLFSAFRCVMRIDPAGLSSPDLVAKMYEMISEDAAHFLNHRQFIEAGGLTKKWADKVLQPAN